MSTGIGTTISNRILNHWLGREPFVVPNIYFLALSTTPLTNDGVGATEPSDPSYQRLVLANNKTTFSVASSRNLSIAREFIYPPSTVAWGRCTHYLIYDNNVGGNVWLYGELQNSIFVEIDTSPILLANVNQINLDICGGSTVDLSLTTQASNRILNHYFGQTPTFTPPAIYYMGVSSTPLNTEGIGFTEPVGGGYQRLALPNDKNTFAFANNKMVTLAQEFRFPISATPWGNMTHFFITDAATGAGNVYWTGRLLHGRTVEVGTTLSVLPNGFRWILDTCVA